MAALSKETAIDITIGDEALEPSKFETHTAYKLLSLPGDNKE